MTATKSQVVRITEAMIEADRRNLEFRGNLAPDECMDYCPVCHVTVRNATSDDLDSMIELSDDPGAPWFDWFYFKQFNPDSDIDDDDGTNRRYSLTFNIVLLEDLSTLLDMITAGTFSSECSFRFKGVSVSEMTMPVVSAYIC